MPLKAAGAVDGIDSCMQYRRDSETWSLIDRQRKTDVRQNKTNARPIQDRARQSKTNARQSNTDVGQSKTDAKQSKTSPKQSKIDASRRMSCVKHRSLLLSRSPVTSINTKDFKHLTEICDAINAMELRWLLIVSLHAAAGDGWSMLHGHGARAPILITLR